MGSFLSDIFDGLLDSAGISGIAKFVLSLIVFLALLYFLDDYF